MCILAERFSGIIPLRRSAILPGGLFIIGALNIKKQGLFPVMNH